MLVMYINTVWYSCKHNMYMIILSYCTHSSYIMFLHHTEVLYKGPKGQRMKAAAVMKLRQKRRVAMGDQWHELHKEKPKKLNKGKKRKQYAKAVKAHVHTYTHTYIHMVIE